MKQPLLLASTSPFRRSLLEKFGLPFDCASPNIDETPFPDESAETLVKRLLKPKPEHAGQNIRLISSSARIRSASLTAR